MKNAKYLKTICSISAPILCLTPVIGLTFGLTSCSSSQKYIDIVSLNDFHGWLEESSSGSVSDRAPVIEQLANAYTEICKEDAINNKTYDSTYFILDGDNSQGSALSNLSNPSGKNTYEMLSSLFHPEYSSIGNHEFDWGQEFLNGDDDHETFQEMGDLKAFLACNIYNADEDGNPTSLVDWVQPYAIVDIDGFNVGFVGYTTYETTTTTTPTNISGLAFADATDNSTKFINGETGADILQDAINACWNDSDDLNNGVKPDAVILLAHAGATELSDGSMNTDSEIYKVIGNITGIDACISGHTHLKYSVEIPDKDGNEIPTGQAGRYGNSLLQTKIYYDSNNHSKYHIEVSYRNIDEDLTYDELSNKDSTLVKYSKRLYDKIYGEMEPTLNAPKINIICDEGDTTIPEQDPNAQVDSDEYHSSVLATLVNYAYYLTLSSDVLSDSDNFPELSNIISTVKADHSSWSDFDGVDVVMNNIGSFRSDLVATGDAYEDTEAQASYTTSDLYSVVPFDNNTYLCKITVGDINDYFTSLYVDQENTHEWIDPFYSSEYLLGYEGSIMHASAYYLVDKTTHQKVDEDKTIYFATNEFFFLDGDGSSWEEAAAKNGGYEVIGATATWDDSNFSIYTSSRNVLIEAAHIWATQSGKSFPTINIKDTGDGTWTYNFDDYYYPVS